MCEVKADFCFLCNKKEIFSVRLAVEKSVLWLISSGGFALLAVSIDIVNLVASKGPGNAQRDGMGMNVIAVQ